MSEQEDVFEVRELATVSCKCSNCGTVVVFDINIDEKFGLPKRCATCNEPLGASAQAFQDYRIFYRRAVAAGATIRLHAKPKAV